MQSDEIISLIAQKRAQARELFAEARQQGVVPDGRAILALRAEEKKLSEQLKQSGHEKDGAGSITEVENGLFLGGLESVKLDVLRRNKITHVLTVCSIHQPPVEVLADLRCKTIAVLDHEDANLLQHFNTAIAFIDEARGNGAVLVHCHAGQSRSPAIVAAYLMRQRGLTRDNAIAQLHAVRDLEINENFLEQLNVFQACGYTTDPNHPSYIRWTFLHQARIRQVSRFNDTMQDSTSTHSSVGHTAIRCRRCRYVLASERYVIEHEPKTPGRTVNACAHFFIEPIRWMKKELDKGQLEGRFDCPKCSTKVGGYAWQGMTCSCRRWILPALALQRAKVDEVRQREPVELLCNKRAQAPAKLIGPM
ncbi:tyrosine protein phosphatase yvh1 [Savitreella phatthalungensis]